MITPSSPLRGLPLAVIDTETTGLVPGHIVEIAVVHLTLGDDAPPRLAYSTRLRPPEPIPAAATAIHGITDADVADAPTFGQAWRDLAAALDGRVLCAHHAPFDAAFLVDECARIGATVKPPEGWLCTKVPAMVADRYKRGKHLGDIAARRGIVLDAHGAAGDAMTAALLAPALWREALRKTGNAGRTALTTLAELLSWQHAEGLRQERDLVAYLARDGAAGEAVDTPWHDLLGVPAPELPPAPAPTWRVERDGTVVRVSP